MKRAAIGDIIDAPGIGRCVAVLESGWCRHAKGDCVLQGEYHFGVDDERPTKACKAMHEDDLKHIDCPGNDPQCGCWEKLD